MTINKCSMLFKENIVHKRFHGGECKGLVVTRKCILYTEDKTRPLAVSVKGANGRGSWPC